MAQSSRCSFWVIEIMSTNKGKDCVELVTERKIYLTLNKISLPEKVLPPERTLPSHSNTSPR